MPSGQPCKPIFSAISVISLGCLCVVLLLVSPFSYTEIYKWTDAKGQIHYSDRKSAAGKIKAEEVKVPSSMNSMPGVKPTIRNVDHAWPEPTPLRSPEKSKSAASGNVKDGVDYRCTLARKILEGQAVLRNGLAVGEYEIETAKRDVANFCD